MQQGMNSILRIPLFFVLFIALGLVFGFLTFKVLSFSRTVEVPGLSNLTMVEANDALSKAGLYLKIEGEDFDSTVPSGHIVRQDVPAGNKVKEKRAIRVVISKGPRVQSLLSLVSMSLPDAEAALLQQGLRIGKVVYVHADNVEKGRIVAQKPEPDEKLSEQITVLVSLGPHEVSYFCPDFANKQLDQAKELAVKLGVVLETTGSGTVVDAQRPKPGTVIRSGDKIYLELKEAASHG